MSTNKSFSTETSDRYSRALFEVASESKELDKIESDIKNFYSVLNSSKEIQSFIQNPTHSLDNQYEAIKILSDKLNFSKNLKNFFYLLIQKRRIFFVKKIIESFLKLCSSKRGEVKASLISSKTLSDKELNEISQDISKFMGSKIKFDYSLSSLLRLVFVDLSLDQ